MIEKAAGAPAAFSLSGDETTRPTKHAPSHGVCTFGAAIGSCAGGPPRRAGLTFIQRLPVP
jgi:hypothetical protein